jgi:hypothetical protein
MEGDRHGKAGEDEVGRVIEREADVAAAAEGAVDHRPGRLPRVFADQSTTSRPTMKATAG